MNILFLIPEFPPQYGGGIATYYRTLIPAVAAEGHEVDVLVGSAFTNDRPGPEEEEYTVEFLDVERRRRAFEKFTAYDVVPLLRQTLAAAWALFQQADGGEGYDIVETTDFGLLFLPWVATEAAPPTIVQLHGSEGQIDAREPKVGGALKGHLTRLFEVQGLSRADVLQSHSRENVHRWSQRLGREVGYMPPPLSPRTPIDSATPPPNKEATGFVAGRIQYWKGPTVLCGALAHLESGAPRIDWAGRDMEYGAAGTSMSEYLADTYPDVWGNSVRPISTIPPEDVSRYQRAANFVVVPSIWDVFNYTAVEAMREGTVVICSDGAGASDIIEDGQNGFVSAAEDEKHLAEAIRSVLSLSEGEREEIGQAARETVREELNPCRIAKRRTKTYDEVVGGEMRLKRDTEWLAEAVRPNGRFEIEGPALSTLDTVPLRKLGEYLLHRVWKKIRSGK